MTLNRKKYFNYFEKRKKLNHLRVSQVFDETTIEGIKNYYIFLQNVYLKEKKHEKIQ